VQRNSAGNSALKPLGVSRAIRKSRAWARVRPSFKCVAVIWCISSSVLTATAQTPTNNPSRTDNTSSLIAAAETEPHPATNQTGSAGTNNPFMVLPVVKGSLSNLPSILLSIPITTPPKPATNQTAFAGSNKRANLSALPIKELKKKAESGDAHAQCELGLCYVLGRGVPSDSAEAVKWYRKAAEQGNADAQDWLGHCYQDGVGVSQDYTEAVKWFRKAAEQGDAAAQSTLGDCYRDGEGVPKDEQEAVKWYHKAAERFRKAAEQGDANAQYHLGRCYENGEGVPQDDAEAVKWYRKAAEQGHELAQIKLDGLYRETLSADKDVVLKGAINWCRKAAEQGDADAQYKLGCCYWRGRGVTRDEQEAVKWYRKAAEQGNVEAQFWMGFSYDVGLGVSKDDKEAVKWYRKAAEQGDAAAQWSLGIFCFNGKGVPQDYVEAYKWYNLAAANDLTAKASAAIGVQSPAELRDQIANRMTPDQIAEGQRRASQFVARPGKAGAGDQSGLPDSDATPTGSGTGFLITVGNSPCVLTAHHVVNEATAIKVVVGGKAFTARVVGADPANDLAVLRIAASASDILAVALPQPALPITGSRQVKLGDSVFTIGFPNTVVQGFAPKLTRGEINSLAGVQDDPRYFQTSVAVQPGNSGGALVDVRGNVIGVMTMRLDDLKTLELTGSLPQNVNYGLKSSFVLAFLESVPELAAALPPPHAENRRFEDVVKEVQQATVLVVTY